MSWTGGGVSYYLVLSPLFLGLLLALTLGIAGGLALWMARRRRT